MIKSLEEAIDYTMKKKGYAPSVIPQILAYLRAGKFSVLTSENGARAYVRSLSPEQLQYEINNYGQKKYGLNELNSIIEDMSNFNEKNGQEENNQQIIRDALFNILNGNQVYALPDGGYFKSIDLKRAMVEKCLLYAEENKWNVQLLYEASLGSQIKAMSQAAELVQHNIGNIDVVYQEIHSNPSFTNMVLKEIVSSALTKDTINYSLDSWRKKFNKLLNDMNVNDRQKSYMLFKKIIDNELNFVETDANLVNRLREMAPQILRLMVLVNSVSLSIYSDSNNQPGISEQERALYGGNYNYTVADIQNIIMRNREILANLSEANSKYGREGMCQYISNLSLSDLEFLCQLYINSNGDKNRQSMMSNIETIFPATVHPSVKMLREELKQEETYKMVSNIERKTY